MPAPELKIQTPGDPTSDTHEHATASAQTPKPKFVAKHKAITTTLKQAVMTPDGWLCHKPKEKV